VSYSRSLAEINMTTAKLTNIAARLFNTPLLCTPTYANVVATVLAPRLGVQPVLQADQIPPERPARAPALLASGIMLVPVVGGLVHRGDSLDAMSGVESYTHLNNIIVHAIKEPECKAILLDVDSPGGEAGGCFELADTLLDARRHKPIWAVANTQACSAAYLIGASATKFYATQSAHIGSIGVAWMHTDISKMLASAGVVTTLLYAGAHKIDGNPFEALSKEDKALFQQSIEESYTLFVNAVAARRPIGAEAARATEARVYRAEEATELKLVDGVKSLQGTLDALAQSLEQKQQKSKGIRVMTTQTEDAIAPEVHAQAVSQARAEGYRAGRTDAAAIVSCEAATGRAAMAANLAGDADLSREKAIALLGTAPVAVAAAPGPQLDKLMETHATRVGAGGADPASPADARAARAAELRTLAKGVSAQVNQR
jgi:signal peptide peptidase SppA